MDAEEISQKIFSLRLRSDSPCVYLACAELEKIRRVTCEENKRYLVPWVIEDISLTSRMIHENSALLIASRTKLNFIFETHIIEEAYGFILERGLASRAMHLDAWVKKILEHH